MRARDEEAPERLPATSTAVTAAMDRATLESVEYLLGRRATGARTISVGQRRRLTSEIGSVTGQQRVDPLLHQAYWSLIELEARGAGRIAGSTSNVLGKLVTTTLLSPPPGPVLEIGSLFGLFAAGLIRQFGFMGDHRHLTVIDPLEGVQVQGGSTAVVDWTSTPVSRSVLESNLGLAGVCDYRVVQGFSTDAAARAAAQDTAYAVVVIDGDHSEDGVIADLRWVESIVLPGAVVVVDDFGGPRWPGVKLGAERHLADSSELQLVGTVSTSAYLRYIG